MTPPVWSTDGADHYLPSGPQWWETWTVIVALVGCAVAGLLLRVAQEMAK